MKTSKTKNTDASLEAVLDELRAERAAQDEKWGEQNHPDVDPVLTGRKGGCTHQRMAEEYEMPTASRAKFIYQTAAARGEISWALIALEELSEAVEAATDHGELAVREEALQLAAVAVQWVQSIDRRAERRAARLLNEADVPRIGDLQSHFLDRKG